MAIILRLNKGSELTFAEVDGNFSSLLYDVALQGTNLLFYTNNGADVLKTTIDLSNMPGFGGISVAEDGATPIIPAATGLNFTGTGVTISANGTIATVDIAGGDGGAILTQELISNQNVGGITSGEVFAQNSTIEALLRDMLITYIEPVISNLTIFIGGTPVSPSSIRDVNESFTCDSITFTAGVDSPDGNFPENSTLSVTGNDPSGLDFNETGPATLTSSNTISFSTKTINSSTAAASGNTVTFTVETESQTTADTQTTNSNFRFQWRNYLLATSVNLNSSSALQTALNNGSVVIQSPFDTNKSWTATAAAANNTGTNFTYIVYPQGHGSITSVILNGALDVFGGFTEQTQQTANNNQSASQTWRIYKSNQPGAFSSGDSLVIS